MATATKDELKALRTKLEALTTLTQAERGLLVAMFDSMMSDVVSDDDLDQVAGGAGARIKILCNYTK